MSDYKIQSVIFSKSKFTQNQAESWLKQNKYKNKGVDEKESTYRYRQLEPSYLKSKGFTNIITKSLGNSGIQLIIGYPKMSGSGTCGQSGQINPAIGVVNELLTYIDDKHLSPENLQKLLNDLNNENCVIDGVFNELPSFKRLIPFLLYNLGYSPTVIKRMIDVTINPIRPNIPPRRIPIPIATEIPRANPVFTANGRNKKMSGGAVTASELKNFIIQSYSPKPENKLGDWVLDSDLSTPTATVYYNPKTNHATITHRGTDETLSDWGNNLAYTVGQYNKTNRFKQGEQVQKAVEQKYGSKNVSTLGHSQGAVLSRKLGTNTKEIINLNPYSVGDQAQGSNEYNIRSGSDIVSGISVPKKAFNKIFYPSTYRDSESRNITIKPTTTGILSEHKPDILDRLDPNLKIGASRIKKNNENKLSNINISNMPKKVGRPRKIKTKKMTGGMDPMKTLKSWTKAITDRMESNASQEAYKKQQSDPRWYVEQERIMNERRAIQRAENEARRKAIEDAKEAKKESEMRDFADEISHQFQQQEIGKGRRRTKKSLVGGMDPMETLKSWTKNLGDYMATSKSKADYRKTQADPEHLRQYQSEVAWRKAYKTASPADKAVMDFEKEIERQGQTKSRSGGPLPIHTHNPPTNAKGYVEDKPIRSTHQDDFYKDIGFGRPSKDFEWLPEYQGGMVWKPEYQPNNSRYTGGKNLDKWYKYISPYHLGYELSERGY